MTGKDMATTGFEPEYRWVYWHGKIRQGGLFLWIKSNIYHVMNGKKK